MTVKLFLSFLFFYLMLFIIFSHYKEAEAASAAPYNGNVYIVYMGSNKNNHDALLSSLLRRNKNALVHSYKQGFSGFAARLSDSEARQLSKQPGVVSVFRDPILQLHTTRSWEYLLEETSRMVGSLPRSRSNADGSQPKGSAATVIGFLDTGIWPESKSFDDIGMDPIPSKWRGKCVTGENFTASNCNKKLIGARFYNAEDDLPPITSPRDGMGHGSHVASTAAGASVQNASYFGLADGVARGGSPASRIAMYRVCSSDGCSGSAILAAFDDAIADGVDILSLSLGGSPDGAPHFSTDTIAIGAFHAVQKGITVVCSAGNDGPSPQSVVNVSPWITTVAASTIDRDFESDIVLGNNKVIKGDGINFSDLKKTPVYPLIYGSAAKLESATEDQARSCDPGSLDATKIKGNIVLCQNEANSRSSPTMKTIEVQAGGAAGIIIINDVCRLETSSSLTFPMTQVSSEDSKEILTYINATENPVATILPSKTALRFKPAPTIACFSSRGPSRSTKNLLKPDIAAPGVYILAAWKAHDASEDTTPKGRLPPQFNLISGTSMACPHVSGIAANIKSMFPAWSPAAVRSAIMTTAIQNNNMHESVTTGSGGEATPYDFGAGQVNPKEALQPGLVYDIEPTDYLLFLCYYGYNHSNIKLIAGELPDGFACPKNSSTAMISNINYPSIAVTMNATTGPVTVKRTVTNVDRDEAATVYSVTVEKPSELEVKVTPNELKFTADTQKLDYQVTFSASSSIKRDLFGAITWTNKNHTVRSPFVVSSD